ncbi:MAG: STAS domain-containing protein [Bacteroidota bacterium]
MREQDPGRGIRVYRPETSLTTENARELVELIRPGDQESAPMVVVDMSRLRSMDSTGVGVLVSARKLTRLLRGNLVLANTAPDMRRLLILMDVHRMIDIYDSVASASRELLHGLQEA